MVARAGKLLVLALLGAAWTAPARAQEPSPPADVVLPPPRSQDAPPLPPPPSAVGTPAPVPAPSPFAPRPAPLPPPDAQDPLYQPRDPGINGWGPYGLPSLPENFFADAEIDILKPHLKAALTNQVNFPGGVQDTVQPPTAQVGWTAAPRFEFGWFIPPSLGFFALSYRGFVSNGQQDMTAVDGTPFAVRTRLDVNQIAIDYGTVPYSYAPRWYASGRIGIGIADVFFDNRAVSAFQSLDASNNYLGAGPHVRLDLWREFNLLPGLAIIGQADLTVLVGQIKQNYRETFLAADGSSVEGTSLLRKTQTVPVFTLRAGLGYTPPPLPCWRFTLGYEFEEWWFVGQVDMLPPRGQFNTNGVFLRAFITF
jgi:hypothetical protein